MSACSSINDSFANTGTMALTRVSRSSAPIPELEPATYAIRDPGLRKLAVIDDPIRTGIGTTGTVRWR